MLSKLGRLAAGSHALAGGLSGDAPERPLVEKLCSRAAEVVDDSEPKDWKGEPELAKPVPSAATKPGGGPCKIYRLMSLQVMITWTMSAV